MRDVIAIDHDLPPAVEVPDPEPDGLIIPEQILSLQIHEQAALGVQNIKPQIMDLVTGPHITVFVEFARVIASIGQPGPLRLFSGNLDLGLD